MNAPDLPAVVMEKLSRVFAAYPELTRVTLFGSRATGKANARSDIDLATYGIADDGRLGRLALDLADLDIPQICTSKPMSTFMRPSSGTSTTSGLRFT